MYFARIRDIRIKHHRTCQPTNSWLLRRAHSYWSNTTRSLSVSTSVSSLPSYTTAAMCYGEVRYACCHTGKRRITCRKIWRRRTGWCCHPVVGFVFGEGVDTTCDVTRDNWTWATTSCPECREAEQTGVATKGRIHDFRGKFTPEALRSARQRKEEEDRQKIQTRWYSREESFQMQQLRRPEEPVNSDRPLPAMPSFVHVPLGDRWGQPSYHYPKQVAMKFPPAPPPEEPLPSVPHKQAEVSDEQQRPIKTIEVVLKNRLVTSPDQPCLAGGQCWKPVPESNPTSSYDIDFRQARRSQEPQQQQYCSKLLGPRSLTNPRPAPPVPIADRRGRKLKPLTGNYGNMTRPSKPRQRVTAPEPSAKSAKTPGPMSLLKALGRAANPECAVNRDDPDSDAHSDISSFVCRDARDIEESGANQI